MPNNNECWRIYKGIWLTQNGMWHCEEEEQSIAHYLKGLNLEIVNVISLQQYIIVDDVAWLAMKVEK